MAERETSRHIDATAADWIARRDRGPLSDDEARALEGWLSGDPRRRGAFLRADALSMLSESAKALGPNFQPRDFEPAPMPDAAVSRRKLLAWAGIGGAVAASLIAVGISAPASGAIATGLGEVRRVTLDDGSTVMLNTQSEVQIHYDDAERRVELLEGEAYFTIVRDPRRPFLVDATGVRVRAARAAFRIRKRDTRSLDIMVAQGDVALTPEGKRSSILLHANSRVLLAPASDALPAPQAIAPDLVTRALAWREGKIAFEGERLDEAAAEFARYSRTHIRIDDAALAGEPVSGLFSASDPIGFSRAVAGLFDARVERRGDAVILSRGAGAT